ncbi:MAG: c-type cytochrome, partial [Pseudomonadota bacterium]|nr:c-type cytochrome [Pseudomonadota bacterium]
AVLLGVVAAPLPAAPLGLGRAATPADIAAWDVDVAPDGTGLPTGQGGVAQGEALFADLCAGCHGDFAEGVGRWPALIGGQGTLASADPVKTAGSFWPYAPTLWDYVNRSMPYGNAQTLGTDDVYALVAYILFANDLIGENAVVSQDSLPRIDMPNRHGFIPDTRVPSEFVGSQAPPCMQNCGPKVEIVMRATDLDVTPK